MNRIPVFVRLRQLAPSALVLFSAIAVVVSYLQAINYPFLSDDVVYVAGNTRLSTLPLAELWRLFVEQYNGMSEFLPLRDLSYWLDMALFGLTPAAFRLHNIVLYLLCLPLVYAITLRLWQLFRPADAEDAASAHGMRWAAATVTALFALNPSHVEAVVWISGRKDLLSGLFSLLALWLALKVKREQELSTLHASAALFVLLAAMLSKATAVAMAPVIALLWMIFWFRLPRANRRRAFLWWPLASLLLAAYIALIFASMTTTRIPPYFGIETVTRLFAVLGWLARLALTPESRHFIYPVFEDPYLPVMVTLGVLILAAVAAGMGVLYRSSQNIQYSRYSLEGFLLVTFFLLCLPSIHLIPYALPSLVSDRFVFLAVWPATLLLIALVWRLSPALRVALLLVIALSWGFQTAERPRDWRSYETMIDADLRTYPGNNMLAMHKIIGVQLQQKSFQNLYEMANSITDPKFRVDMIRMIDAVYVVRIESASTGNSREAITRLRQWELDLKQMPVQAKWNPPIHNLWELRRGFLTLHWQILADRFPNDAIVRYYTGLRLLGLQRFEAASVHLRAATELQGLQEAERGTAFYRLGLALLRSGQVAAAEVPLYAALIQSPPDLRAYCLFAEVYQQTGRLDEAARARADCSAHAANEAAVR